MKLKELGNRKFKNIKDKLIQIESLMRYERPKEGVNSYHICTHCEENHTRTGRCFECLRKEYNRCKSALERYQWSRKKNGKKRI